MLRPLVPAWFGAAMALACSEAERPDRLGFLDVQGESGGPATFIGDDDTLHPSTESPCGAATLALEFLRPNLYFAIDASGSMSEGIPLGQSPEPDPSVVVPPSQRYGALALAIQTLLQRVGHRVNYGATLFPSGEDACGSGEEVLPLTAGDTVSFAVSGEVGPVLGDLMFSIYRRSPRGGTPAGSALSTIRERLAGRGPESYVFLLTDGGPNCNPQLTCTADACIPNIEATQISSSARCEAPINCCDGGYFGPDNCLDDSGTLQAVEALAELGVKTFVIGIPGSEIYADLLGRLAVAGGTARAGATAYYGVADAEALVETVSAIGLQVSLSCIIELTEPPPDRELVNLFFDGELVPADDTHGWTWTDERTVTVVGDSCRLMEAGDVLQADVVAGCPVVIR